METKDTCFCEESFIDRSFFVLEILRGGGAHFVPPPSPTPMAAQAKQSHGEWG